MKKKLVLIATLFLFLNHSFSQTIDKLDEKKGFKDFQIGDSYDKWKDKIVEVGRWDDGDIGYNYTGSCCKEIFDYPIKEILLRFKNKSLEAIIITTENFQKPYSETGSYTQWRDKDFERIKNLFSQLFGPPTSLNSNEGNVNYYWEGKEVVLVSMYQYLGVNNGDNQQIIIHKAKNILNNF